MRLIPAIDIIDGQCVRLTQGDYEQKKTYYADPLEAARQFEDAGMHYLHLVDLDGAKAGAVTNWDVAATLASKTQLQIDFGGGIKTEKEIRRLLDLGIAQVNLGSIAIKQPALVHGWIKKFGPDKIVLSADVKDGFVHINGWLDSSRISLDELVSQYHAQGILYIACTDISKDGMLTGPNFELYRKALVSFPEIRWIASGGIQSLEDLYELHHMGLSGAIIGKAIYENKIALDDLNQGTFNL